ncbi:MAG: hypothetical protein GX130_02020 [Candidatus Hydrogenedens sp.]|jgi:hypothetical protein|nr:hypothetical protein [Candidatus Hydrogenedens sp.]
MIPQQDALIMGPCPECQKFVVVFAGTALPLDSEIMQTEDREEIYNHVYEVVSAHLKHCVDKLFSPSESQKKRIRRRRIRIQPPKKRPGITDEELEEFVKNELPKLDNPDYFRTIFG